jgi:hypothetical protein
MKPVISRLSDLMPRSKRDIDMIQTSDNAVRADPDDGMSAAPDPVSKGAPACPTFRSRDDFQHCSTSGSIRPLRSMPLFGLPDHSRLFHESLVQDFDVFTGGDDRD